MKSAAIAARLDRYRKGGDLKERAMHGSSRPTLKSVTRLGKGCVKVNFHATMDIGRKRHVRGRPPFSRAARRPDPIIMAERPPGESGHLGETCPGFRDRHSPGSPAGNEIGRARRCPIAIFLNPARIFPSSLGTVHSYRDQAPPPGVRQAKGARWPLEMPRERAGSVKGMKERGYV